MRISLIILFPTPSAHPSIFIPLGRYFSHVRITHINTTNISANLPLDKTDHTMPTLSRMLDSIIIILLCAFHIFPPLASHVMTSGASPFLAANAFRS
ncbi:hypothetical protein BGX38DRAFT_1155403 [Terfezia claveryi]|nr:hypothetical protein BGX38DRAFT_1155403 [Terfezia claveryi]